MKLPTVAIIGRPNVGKSTLFNRLIGAPTAIVEGSPGVTRDRIYEKAEWNGKRFLLIDTGGIIASSQDIFQKEIKKQATIAQEEADVILLVVDVTSHITSEDETVVRLLRTQQKPILVVANKADNESRRLEATVFYALGFEHVFPLSSISGSGTGELLDKITSLLPEDIQETSELNDIPKIAVLGQPNVGKSTLINALLNENRTLVTDIAGTTRDAIHTLYRLYDKKLLLIDTAGLRRKDRSKENVEFYSAIRTVKSIDQADICLLLFDAGQENMFPSQDLAIFSTIAQKGKGIVLLGNKWDTVETKETNTMKYYTEYLKKKITPFSDVPILFVSALKKKRIYKALDIAIDVYQRKSKRISTSSLNEWLKQTIENYAPPLHRGKSIKVNYMTQLPTKATTFVFFCNHPDAVSFTYKQYLKNRLRAYFPLTGIPIKLYFRKK